MSHNYEAVTSTHSLGAILSVTTGRLLAPMSEVHALLDRMTGDVLYTHQLPRAAGECAPELLRQHPHLDGIEVPTLVSPDDYLDWVAAQEQRYGQELAVAPLDPADHTVIDPLSEMSMHWPDVPVVVVTQED